jgi:hypothetical protein
MIQIIHSTVEFMETISDEITVHPISCPLETNPADSDLGNGVAGAAQRRGKSWKGAQEHEKRAK